MGSFVFEIGCEELPVSAQAIVRATARENAQRILDDMHIAYETITVHVAPCRIAFLIENIADVQTTDAREITGPSKAAAYSPDGKPTNALLGFMKKNNVSLDMLTTATTERGEYVVARVAAQTQQTTALLPAVCMQLIQKISFSKTMGWNETKIRFARPIRWCVALIDDKVVQFEYAGISSGNTSFGLRGHNGKPVVITHARDYVALLRKHHVIPDYAERKKMLMKQLKRLTKTYPTMVKDEALIDEVVGLVEYPTTIVGAFKETFLQLPFAVIDTVLKHHQRSFAMKDTPCFVGVKNGRASKHDAIIREGYERVASARLTDALFFHEHDCHIPLAQRVETLKTLVYQEQLGSMFDKTQRMQTIAQHCMTRIGGYSPEDSALIERAITLSKTDLLTEMVKEFPELQGVMGKIYAQPNEDAQVADALFEQYLPRNADDALPTSRVGCVVSVADKLDNIVSSFMLGHRPTGSNDPFGLKRQADSIVALCIAQQWDLDVVALLGDVCAVFAATFDTAKRDEALKALTDFFVKRLENWLTEKDFPFDVVRAVVYNRTRTCIPYHIFSQTESIAVFRRENADFLTLAALYKRANNILKQAIEKNMFDAKTARVDATRCVQDEEKALLDGITTLNLETLLAQHEYTKAMEAIVHVKPLLDRFFEKIMVMDNDPIVRTNRLALLNTLVTTFRMLADFSQIV